MSINSYQKPYTSITNIDIAELPPAKIVSNKSTLSAIQ